jgi:protein-tyrosine phosphatase
MRAQLYWLPAQWAGKLALAARPRGGDWLEDEIRSWRASSVDTVVSLLTPEEETELSLLAEAANVRTAGMEFISFPIPDRDVPGSQPEFARLITALQLRLTAGKSVLVHCRQGIGRTATVAAGLLIASGQEPEQAFGAIEAARGIPVPETGQQRVWVEAYAASEGRPKPARY